VSARDGDLGHVAAMEQYTCLGQSLSAHPKALTFGLDDIQTALGEFCDQFNLNLTNILNPIVFEPMQYGFNFSASRPMPNSDTMFYYVAANPGGVSEAKTVSQVFATFRDLMEHVSELPYNTIIASILTKHSAMQVVQPNIEGFSR
jgi:hypothetical protein